MRRYRYYMAGAYSLVMYAIFDSNQVMADEVLGNVIAEFGIAKTMLFFSIGALLCGLVLIIILRKNKF